MAAWNELSATGGLDECAALVHSAETLRFSAPELAVQLARRALLVGASVTGADPGFAKPLSMRAQAVLAAGLVAINRHVEAIAPAAAALGFAERGGVPELATAMRLELAACAREVGEPLVGSAVLRPVLTDSRARPAVRGDALGRLVGCVTSIARRDDVEAAIVEADRLFAADDGLSVDARRLERARLAVRTAAYHRWYGDVEDAVEVSRDGLSVLARVRDEDAASGRLRARLVLELICALLDSGELDEAESVARPVIDEPVRATSALPVGRIMLAVSTRVHLPGGRVDHGRHLLDRAVRLAERHGLDSLLADARTTVSELDERAGRFAESLAALQSARAAEQRRLLAVAKASRVLLTEVDHAGRRTGQTVAAANALLRQVLTQAVAVPAPQTTEITQQIAAVPLAVAPSTGQDTDEATGLLNGDGLARRLRAVRIGDRPVALTLVRLDHDEYGGTRDLTELARQVRSLAPAGAELARPAGAELAVLLPHTTLDQAEQLAATIGRTAIESADADGRAVTVSTGAAQSGEDTDALLSDARGTLTPAERPAAEAIAQLQDAAGRPEHAAEANGTAIRRGLDFAGARESLTVGRSILSSLSIPSGSGGRRRADPAEAAAPAATDSRPGHEATKDELTSMMSALSAGTLRVPPSPAAGARNGTRVADGSLPARQSLPTPPPPDDVPTPPTPPARPDIPEPAEPTPVPQPPPEPTDPQPTPDSADPTRPPSRQPGLLPEALPQREVTTPSWATASSTSTSTTAAELAALWSDSASNGSRDTAPADPTQATAQADSPTSWGGGWRPDRAASVEPPDTAPAAENSAESSDLLTPRGSGSRPERGAAPADSTSTALVADSPAKPFTWATGSRPDRGAAPVRSTATTTAADGAAAEPSELAELAELSTSGSAERPADRGGVPAVPAETTSATERAGAEPSALWAAAETTEHASPPTDPGQPAASWQIAGSGQGADTGQAADTGQIAETEIAGPDQIADPGQDADIAVAAELAALWVRAGGDAEQGTVPAAGTETGAAPTQTDTHAAPRRSTTTPPAPRVPSPAAAPPGPVLGPPARPAERSDQEVRIPRSERSDSTTIAGLLAEALAAYQSSVDEEQAAATPEVDPIAEFQQRTGAAGRHRSPE